MIIAASPQNEEARLAVLAALALLDTPAEAIFDCATRTVAGALGTPIALVSLVDASRQWFKSRVGLDAPETPRDLAFCAHAIADDALLVVEDTASDQRFADNPLVTGAPHIRFYAGVPIRSQGGLALGTLCAIDTAPRRLSAAQLQILNDQAALLSREVQNREAALLARQHVALSTQAMLDGEALFRSAFELAGIGIAIVEPDGGFRRVNRALCDIVGYGPDELLQRSFQDITCPEDLADDLRLVERVLSGELDHYQMDKRYLTKRGDTVWVHLTVAPQRDANGATQYFISMIEDVTARKASEDRIVALTANLEAQVNSRTLQLHQAIDCAERRNQQLRTLTEATALLSAANHASEVAAIVQGFVPKIFAGASGALFLGAGSDYRRVAQWGVDPHFAEQLHGHDCWGLRRAAEFRVEDPADPLHCAHWRVAPPQPHVCMPVLALGEAHGLLELYWPADNSTAQPDTVLLGTLTRQLGLAISNLQLREELRLQALHDPLTGLYNRRYLDDFIRQRLAEYARNAHEFGVLMVDFDHFKTLNDAYGHEFGDSVLVEVAALLKRCVRSDEAAFRYGGEEFLVVVRCTKPDDAQRCADRIREAVSSLQLHPPGHPASAPRLSVSIGVATCPAHGADFASIIAGADAAVYAAKANGRNRVCAPPVFKTHPSMN